VAAGRPKGLVECQGDVEVLHMSPRSAHDRRTKWPCLPSLWPVTAVRGANIVASFGTFYFPLGFVRKFLFPRVVTTDQPFLGFLAETPGPQPPSATMQPRAGKSLRTGRRGGTLISQTTLSRPIPAGFSFWGGERARSRTNRAA
jgi:hypothetical protein